MEMTKEEIVRSTRPLTREDVDMIAGRTDKQNAVAVPVCVYAIVKEHETEMQIRVESLERQLEIAKEELHDVSEWLKGVNANGDY